MNGSALFRPRVRRWRSSTNAYARLPCQTSKTSANLPVVSRSLPCLECDQLQVRAKNVVRIAVSLRPAQALCFTRFRTEGNRMKTPGIHHGFGASARLAVSCLRASLGEVPVWRRPMKLISPQFALLATILVSVFATPGSAQDRSTERFAHRDLQAKIAYCKTCHGLSGQGYRGYLPMPRLAGQQSVYFENQLRAFIERRRANPIMYNVAHALSPSMLTALAAHFKDLDPEPIGGAPREMVSTGKTIYEDGLPQSNVPACAACHGMEAKGQGEIPRLAGQFFPYTVKALTNWSRERGQGGTKADTSAIMQPTAHNLTQSQIAAVAAYVGSLR
jgi:cytochrome c553